ncbi:helix-turn-helix domain-containing protein [Burkholderia vietnamiensis]|uniref:helix-turn-helix domain-containing protein n=1 Tax=Burkholderia vietnamiensis TaxID=60552 RepID=UPI001CF10222|nr:helix-turn-helix transcriptional regulator [Burkholderia vietnamiensis]MCA8449004.1 helix-turn-helix domain-containing protein [Burkholderia vietnamiensis]
MTSRVGWVVEASENVQRSRKLISRIGPRLAERRREIGLTQTRMAERMGIAEESLSRLESGRVTPTIERLIQFCDVLGLSLDDVLLQVSAVPSDEAKVLTKSIEDLTPMQREVVLANARNLADLLRQQNAG